MFKKLMLALALAFSMGAAQAGVLLFEDFKDVGALAGQGWVFQNRCIPPAASSGWIQGERLIFDAHTPPPNSYAGSSFMTEIPGSFIDDRLYTPEFLVENSVTATFYLRGEDFGNFVDMVSYGFTDGGTELGNFIVLEQTVVPRDDWMMYSITLAAQGPGAMARLGFRHFGLQDTSNVVGLDSLTMTENLTPDPGKVPEPASILMLGFGMAGLTLARRRRR